MTASWIRREDVARVFMHATRLLRIAGIVVFYATTSWANSSPHTEIKGDFGFYVNGINALPLPFAEVGRFTADGKGAITGNVTTQTSMGTGLPSATSTSALSGTYVLNTDGTGTMTLTIGAFHFVIDDNGNEIRLTQDSSAAAGIA
jgi:hypothetical protein